MPRLLPAFVLFLFATSSSAADPNPLPKPLKGGEKAEKGEWVGKKVLPKKPLKDVRMGDWKDAKEEFWEPHTLLNCTVREDRSGFLRVFDGRREGWVSKDDLVTAADAPAYFDRAVKADAKNTYARWMRGVGRLEAGELNDAIADFDELLSTAPEDVAAYNSRGRAWQAKSEHAKAISDYTAVIKLDPKGAMAFNNRGCVLADTGKYDEAIEDYTEALRLEPELVLARYNRGNSWLKKKEYEKSLADYTAALKLDPTDGYTLAGAAIASGKLKKYAEAVNLFEKAVAVEQAAWILRDYARFRATCPDGKHRDGKLAVELATKAVETAGKEVDWEYHHTLAAAKAEVGEFDAAIQEQQQAIKMLNAAKSPDADLVKQAEARLELYKAKKPYRDGE